MPETRADIIDHAAADGHSRHDAEREVSRLEIAARLLPDALTAYGMMPTPNITVEPHITVEPRITVEAAESGSSTYEDAMRSQAAMSGSAAVLRGSGE